jgi:hypothetical protein
LNGYYAVYLVDGTESYRDAVRKALDHIDKYRSFDWENGSADGYADAIESALNLLNREQRRSVARWIDSEIGVMWEKQQDDGIIEGWHGDGNFARTTLMYSLWKSMGIVAQPWRQDVRVGAVGRNGGIYIGVLADSTWKGQLRFDRPRSLASMRLPLDWPRINQFPEWYVVDRDSSYHMRQSGTRGVQSVSGATLIDGLSIEVSPDNPTFLSIQ